MSKRLHGTNAARPTVHDVARAAGVSTATVSRVLNASADVSETLRDKVTQTMETLGYVRDSTARALATRRSLLVGIILPRHLSPFMSSILSGFEQPSAANGFGTLIARSSWAPADLQGHFRHLIEHGVEGVFATGPLDEACIAAAVSSRDLPLVSIAENPPTNGPAAQSRSLPVSSSTIDIGLDAAARRLAAHVSDLGHKHIAIVSETRNQAPLARSIARGAVAEFSRRDTPDPVYVETNNTSEAGSRAFAALLEMNEPPTAILCTGAELAAGILYEAQRRGIGVPDDISIAAFSCPQAARSTMPALSGIELDPAEIGHLAAQSLSARIESTPVSGTLHLPAALTLRDSLAPPRSRK